MKMKKECELDCGSDIAAFIKACENNNKSLVAHLVERGDISRFNTPKKSRLFLLAMQKAIDIYNSELFFYLLETIALENEDINFYEDIRNLIYDASLKTSSSKRQESLLNMSNVTKYKISYFKEKRLMRTFSVHIGEKKSPEVMTKIAKDTIKEIKKTWERRPKFEIVGDI